MKKEKDVCEASNRLKDLILNYFPSLKVFAEFIELHPTYITRLVREVDPNNLRIGTLKKFETKLGFNVDYILTGKGDPIIDKSIFNLAIQRFTLYAKENKINIAATEAPAIPNTYNNSVFIDILNNLSIAYSNNDSISELLNNQDVIKITCLSGTLEKSGIKRGTILIINTNYQDKDNIIFLYRNNVYYGILKDNEIIVKEFNLIVNKKDVEIIGKVIARIVFE